MVDEAGLLVGVITRRDLLDHDADDAVPLGSLIRRPPVVVYPGSTLREAADQMVRAHVGRLPVVDRSNPRRVVGMITRSDLLGAHASRLEAGVRRQVGLSI